MLHKYASYLIFSSLLCVFIFLAEEEDFREYCSSLLKVPVSKDSTESQVSTPEFYLEIEILDEVKKRTTFIQELFFYS